MVELYSTLNQESSFSQQGSNMAISKTMQAVRRVQAGETVREVARALDISEAAIYAQLKRERDLTRCPCCGQVVKEGYKVNRAVLKQAK